MLVLNKDSVIYPTPLPKPTEQSIPEAIRNDPNEAKIYASTCAYPVAAVMARRAMQVARLGQWRYGRQARIADRRAEG